MEDAKECTGPGCGKAHTASTVNDLGGGRAGLSAYRRAWRRRAAGEGDRLRCGGWDAKVCPLSELSQDYAGNELTWNSLS